MASITRPITAGLTSAITGDAGSVPAAPVALSNPVILGTPTEGVATTFLPAAFSGNPVPGIATQWLLDAVEIPGETGDTYTPVLADVGGTLTVRQTATNASGSDDATSAGVVVVAGGAGTQAWDGGQTWDSGVLWS